jgi:hypothetical protein
MATQNQEPKTKITVPCDAELRQKIEEMAAAEDRQMADMSRVLLREAIRVREGTPKKMQRN